MGRIRMSYPQLLCSSMHCFALIFTAILARAVGGVDVSGMPVLSATDLWSWRLGCLATHVLEEHPAHGPRYVTADYLLHLIQSSSDAAIQAIVHQVPMSIGQSVLQRPGFLHGPFLTQPDEDQQARIGAFRPQMSTGAASSSSSARSWAQQQRHSVHTSLYGIRTSVDDHRKLSLWEHRLVCAAWVILLRNGPIGVQEVFEQLTALKTSKLRRQAELAAIQRLHQQEREFDHRTLLLPTHADLLQLFTAGHRRILERKHASQQHTMQGPATSSNGARTAEMTTGERPIETSDAEGTGGNRKVSFAGDEELVTTVSISPRKGVVSACTASEGGASSSTSASSFLCSAGAATRRQKKKEGNLLKKLSTDPEGNKEFELRLAAAFLGADPRYATFSNPAKVDDPQQQNEERNLTLNSTEEFRAVRMNLMYLAANEVEFGSVAADFFRNDAATFGRWLLSGLSTSGLRLPELIHVRHYEDETTRPGCVYYLEAHIPFPDQVAGPAEPLSCYQSEEPEGVHRHPQSRGSDTRRTWASCPSAGVIGSSRYHPAFDGYEYHLPSNLLADEMETGARSQQQQERPVSEPSGEEPHELFSEEARKRAIECLYIRPALKEAERLSIPRRSAYAPSAPCGSYHSASSGPGSQYHPGSYEQGPRVSDASGRGGVTSGHYVTNSVPRHGRVPQATYAWSDVHTPGPRWAPPNSASVWNGAYPMAPGPISGPGFFPPDAAYCHPPGPVPPYVSATASQSGPTAVPHYSPPPPPPRAEAPSTAQIERPSASCAPAGEELPLTREGLRRRGNMILFGDERNPRGGARTTVRSNRKQGKNKNPQPGPASAMQRGATASWLGDDSARGNPPALSPAEYNSVQYTHHGPPYPPRAAFVDRQHPDPRTSSVPFFSASGSASSVFGSEPLPSQTQLAEVERPRAGTDHPLEQRAVVETTGSHCTTNPALGFSSEQLLQRLLVDSGHRMSSRGDAAAAAKERRGAFEIMGDRVREMLQENARSTSETAEAVHKERERALAAAKAMLQKFVPTIAPRTHLRDVVMARKNSGDVVFSSPREGSRSASAGSSPPSSNHSSPIVGSAASPCASTSPTAKRHVVRVVQSFGSHVNGLDTVSSDLDVTAAIDVVNPCSPNSLPRPLDSDQARHLLFSMVSEHNLLPGHWEVLDGIHGEWSLQVDWHAALWKSRIPVLQLIWRPLLKWRRKGNATSTSSVVASHALSSSSQNNSTADEQSRATRRDGEIEPYPAGLLPKNFSNSTSAAGYQNTTNPVVEKVSSPPAANEILLDLTIGNENAVGNTELIRAQTEKSVLVRDWLLVVKLVLKKANVVGAKTGWLSSHGWALVGLHFLQMLHIVPMLPPELAPEPIVVVPAAAPEGGRTRTRTATTLTDESSVADEPFLHSAGSGGASSGASELGWEIISSAESVLAASTAASTPADSPFLAPSAPPSEAGHLSGLDEHDDRPWSVSDVKLFSRSAWRPSDVLNDPGLDRIAPAALASTTGSAPEYYTFLGRLFPHFIDYLLQNWDEFSSEEGEFVIAVRAPPQHQGHGHETAEEIIARGRRAGGDHSSAVGSYASQMALQPLRRQFPLFPRSLHSFTTGSKKRDGHLILRDPTAQHRQWLSIRSEKTKDEFRNSVARAISSLSN
ncbi:unnamed protein product [Amoebophrya sp. A120]|nr:unnamed protein product [Amoebophrya sp. A120]|eukprot:GSA120T00002200001.1